MSNQLGIMQGRFTNKGGFFPQYFPWENWRNEFELAKNYDINCIEWMFNAEKFQENPIWTENGKSEIKQVILNTGVTVSSICANYFMQHSITDKKHACYILEHLIQAAQELGICQIIIPLFGESEITNAEAICDVFRFLCRMLSESAIKIGFESDIPVLAQKSICQEVKSNRVGICYDVGNAAGNGYNCANDLLEIQEYLLEVHLKDKPNNGKSVMLGEGAVDFEAVFRNLEAKGRNCYILESYFEQDAIRDTRKNIQYIWGKLYG